MLTKKEAAEELKAMLPHLECVSIVGRTAYEMAIDALSTYVGEGDYISRKMAIERFCNIYCACSPDDCGFRIPQDGAEECAAVRVLQEIPAADVQPVVRGEWITRTDVAPYRPDGEITSWTYKCAICGMLSRLKYNFCPNCGADMRKNQEIKNDNS